MGADHLVSGHGSTSSRTILTLPFLLMAVLASSAVGAVEPPENDVAVKSTAPGVGNWTADCVDVDEDGHCASADCDDTNADVYQGAPEICDGVNNDCNHEQWPSLAVWVGQAVSDPSWDTRSLFAADVNGDGDVDVLSSSSDTDTIAWHENTAGDGSVWTDHAVSTSARGVWAVSAADVDGDSDVDVLSGSLDDDTISWHENTAGDGSAWTDHEIMEDAGGVRSLFAADVDGDGDMDVLSASAYGDTVAWHENWAGDGSGWVTHLISTSANNALSVFAADVDGDNDVDILSASFNDSIDWYENTAGDGSAWVTHLISVSAAGARSVFAADVDGDSDMDVLSASRYDDKVAWYENTVGNGSVWSAHEISTTADNAASVFAMDLDGDSDVDVLSASTDDDTVAWYENTAGDGSAWYEHEISTIAGGTFAVLAADVDGDGDPDVLSAQDTGYAVQWYRHDSIEEDNDGDGLAECEGDCDDARPSCTTDCTDADGDGWPACAECDDGDAASYPGAVELCDGNDNNCIGGVPADEADGDGDHYVECVGWNDTQGDQPWILGGADCDPADDTIHPGATEICDGVNNDCDQANWPSLVQWHEQRIPGTTDDAASIFAVDVDGDSDQDVLSASRYDDTIAWYENAAGDGSAWSERVISTTADGAISVFGADVDGDSDVDVLSVSTYDDKVAWYENTAGDGSAWTEHVISTTADGAQSVFAVDVDGDGDVDVLSASYNDDTIAWYENTAGDGSAWTAHVITPGADGTRSVFAADVDGDSDVDVVSGAKSGWTVAWYENTAGDGSAWVKHGIRQTADPALSVSAADLDGDGDADVVAAFYNDDRVTWYENTAGDGSAWTPRQITLAANGAWSVFAADVDGDSNVDVLAVSSADDTVAWYENTSGDGSTWATHVISAGVDGAVFAVDVDGDSDVDVLSNASGGGAIAWYEHDSLEADDDGDGLAECEGDCDDTILECTADCTDADGDGRPFCVDCDDGDAASYPGAVELCDGNDNTCAGQVPVDELDQDGDDYVECQAWFDSQGDQPFILGGADCDEANATVYPGALNLCDGLNNDCTDPFWPALERWTEHVISWAAGAVSPVAADVDGDGEIDVLWASSSDHTIAWHENTAGDGSAWTEHVISIMAGGRTWVRAADVDGDDDLDVLSASDGSDRIEWHENTAGDGSAWTKHPISLINNPLSIFAADVDGDSDVDVLSASTLTDTVIWYENTAGDGSAWVEHVISTTADWVTSLFATDVDGDGDMDVLSAARDDDTIEWYENTAGDGSAWTAHVISAVADSAHSVFAVDVDGDSDVDVLSAARGNATIAWYENTAGDGSAWSAHSVSTTAYGAMSVFALDMDGDSDVDVLSASYDDDTIAWYENTAGDGSAWTEYVVSTTTNPAASVFAADMNGDGEVDVLSSSESYRVSWHDKHPVEDQDQDGLHCTGDCDDFNPYCTTDCTDLDGDGFCVTTDCDDSAPNCTTDCTDADSDGFCVTTDCDDSSPDCTTDCSDADADGLRACDGDCDEGNPNCTTDCTDLDADGFCVTTDCDDSGPNCTTDCTDADSDGYCVTTDCDDSAPLCTTDCTGDADGDGSATCADCDDGNASIYPGAVESCDGNDLSCAGAVPADEVDDDGDGYVECIGWDDVQGDQPWILGGGDCDDGDASVYPAAPPVCDGVNNDCNDPLWPSLYVGVEHVISATAVAVSVTAANVDGDGDVDVLSASSWNDRIAWYANTAGDGSAWTEQAISTNADGAESVFAEDVDGDSDVDVLSASLNDDTIAWYENTAGDGSAWTRHAISTTADGAVSVFAGDVDGDSDVDVLSASSYDNTIAWHENTAGDGSAWSTHTISTAAVGAESVFAADVDGDSDLDVLSASAGDDTIAWYENTAGNGSAWSAHTISTAAFGALSVFAVDVDGDSDVDVLSASFDDDTIAWYENTAGDGSAWITHGISTAEDGATSVFAVDVDGNSDVDVLSASFDDDTIAWYENATGDGSAWIRHEISVAADGALSVFAADVDGDGEVDALSASQYGNVSWHTGGSVEDADEDGFLCADDCDDENPQCTTDCTDVDSDGFCVTTDCDDMKPNCTTDCTDVDVDGFCVTTDCDDGSPTCTTDCSDADSDGLRFCDGDCDDGNPECTTDCTDVDADGFCVTTDCDDGKPHCTTDCTDVDADGFCVTTDCDDSSPACAADCTDADQDGFRICDGDCDDGDGGANPGELEDCTDASDNDCNGLSDTEDPACLGLTVTGLRFTGHGRSTLEWDSATSADGYALYRGTIPRTGFAGYDHLCEVAELAGTTAEDPDTPLRGESFYYLATGQTIQTTPDPLFVSGSLGFASSGSPRPESSTVDCGVRLHVDPDLVVGPHDGLSWATAYTGVSGALTHGRFRDRDLEIWIRGSLTDNAVLHSANRGGARLLGGFAGTEDASWERSPGTTSTTWAPEGAGANLPVLRLVNAAVVLDGLTLRDGSTGILGAPGGRLVALENVRLEQFSGDAVDLSFSDAAGSRIEVRDSVIDLPGTGGLRAVSTAGELSGRIRRNVFQGTGGTALLLKASPSASDASVAVDVVANTISGVGTGILLGAQVGDLPYDALQSSFVGSNLIHGTQGSPIVVEANGDFATTEQPVWALARPLIVGNTLTDGGAGGVRCVASRTDTTADPSVHEVRCEPEIWDNLITFNAGLGIEETADDPPMGLSADPLVVGNDLYANAALYLDEGTTYLTIGEVNALAGAYDNYSADPVYQDRPAGDYHLRSGTVVGSASSMRYLANSTDPGLGLLWVLGGFDAASWATGTYGVGYETGPLPNASGLLSTLVPSGTLSVYTRLEFDVIDAGAVTSLLFGADYDDGCVVWLNGVEVFRSASMPGSALEWNTPSGDHESSNGQSPVYEQHDITLAGLPQLKDGVNVLAVGIWNTDAGSDDLVLVPQLILDEEHPSIDAGHPEATRMAIEDIDGEARVRDGDLDGTALPDTGADER